MVVDTTVISLSCILSELLKKLGFARMAVANLHIRNKYICHWFQIVFILIIDVGNTGMDTIFVRLSCIVSIILNKIDCLIIEALICI